MIELKLRKATEFFFRRLKINVLINEYTKTVFTGQFFTVPCVESRCHRRRNSGKTMQIKLRNPASPVNLKLTGSFFGGLRARQCHHRNERDI